MPVSRRKRIISLPIGPVRKISPGSRLRRLNHHAESHYTNYRAYPHNNHEQVIDFDADVHDTDWHVPCALSSLRRLPTRAAGRAVRRALALNILPLIFSRPPSLFEFSTLRLITFRRNTEEPQSMR